MISHYAITATVAFFMGLMCAVGLNSNYEKEMAKAGYMVISAQAYRMVPVPNENRP